VIGLTDAQRTSIELQLTFSVTDEGTWLYKNFKYPRYRNFYGYAQIMSGAYVVEDIELVHINQEILHWQQCCTDILQSIGCGVKKVLANVTPPVESQVTLYLLRQRYTSVRFRLCPGVKANIGLSWHFPEQLCDDLLVAPSESQGQPQSSNNRDGNPGNRPGDQPEDAKDTSNNDGKDDPLDNKPVEPKPGDAIAGSGRWFAVYTGYDVGCIPNPNLKRFELPGATDGSITPILVETGTGSCGSPTKDGTVTYNGAVVDQPRDYTNYGFEFIPTP